MGVTGLGGLFFRARDPEALNAWYQKWFQVGAGCVADPNATANEWVWQTMGGPMVFSAFKADTDYFAADKAFMINFRVDDLANVLAPLRAAGIEVLTKPEWDDPMTGKFARVHDPEGNPIELWEPPKGA
jgi:predicted enzyme related to lactoylglutathione lyase